MTESIFDRINQRLAALDLSPEGASKKAGLTRDYLRTLFRQQSSPTVKTLAKLATALETSPEWLMHGVGEVVNVSPKESAATNRKATKTVHEVTPVNMPVPSQTNMHKDLPVLGTAAGSHTNGVLSLEANIIEYVRRPPGVEAVKDAYAVYVEGDSMEPRYYAGDLIIAHPYRPARIGDSVVVQFKRGEADYQEAIIGILHKRSGSKIEIEKLNPQNILNFDEENVIAIHRILSLNDLLGV
ncbi:XRE family transcriptional regulator [Bartonella sp. HY038]|uniref:XRE family transcriptional regulator n=1 Tax=Bartonella sp. HY038 TaxID=2759660 RepID=UPI0015F8AE2B|nr:S24 family peptidase [Bartonella sp. HY038]